MASNRRRGGAHDTRPPDAGPQSLDRDRNRLSDLIESATTSPDKHVDLGLLQAIKSLVRSSDSNVHTAFELLFEKLKKNHSQVRYLAVMLIDELFTRSKLFRSFLVSKFETFMLLSIGYRADYPLPPPSDRATLLRLKSMEFVEKWNDMFGLHYKQVRLGYDYLKKTLRLQFPNLRETAALAEQQRLEREERTQALVQKKYANLRHEFPNLKAEVQSTIDQMAECFNILAPNSIKEFAVQDQREDGDLEGATLGAKENFQFNKGVLEIGTDVEEDEDEYEEYGDWSLRRQLHEDVGEDTTVVEKLWETQDNAAVFETLRDLYKLLGTRYLSSTQEWLSILMRVDPPDKGARDMLLKGVIDLRNELLAARDTCEGLGIKVELSSTAPDNFEDPDEIVWEEGRIENPEAESMPQAVGEKGAFMHGESSKCQERAGRGSAVASTSNSSREDENFILQDQVKEDEAGPRQKLLKEAPLLAWGSFLDTWGSQSAVPANQRGLQFENHWGKVDYDAIIPPEKIAEMNLRSTPYKPVEREIPPCLAPLKKGGLCQRRDRNRCPLHGPVIPRDAVGNSVVEKHGKQLPASEHMDKLPRKGPLDGGILGTHAADWGVEGSDVESLIEHESSKEAVVGAIVAQAVANIRERDEVDAKRKREERGSTRRAQSRRDREHNEAVLRSAAIARTAQGLEEALNEQLEDPFSGSGYGQGGKKKTRGGLTALLQRKPTAKDRLARKLLNARVRDATVCHLTREEDARYRDAYPNQW